jgi:pimeloyl-ACP methyl ester carboxylesterase
MALVRRVWLIAVAVLAGGAAACRSGTAAPLEAGTSEPLMAGKLVDVACEAGFPSRARCARLAVYENRSTRTGRTIPLWIVIVPARGASRAADPVFFLAGGPGQAAGDLLRAPIVGRAGFRRTRDLVLVDQRGTGRSNGLTCQFYGPPRNPQSYFQEFLPLAKVRACRDRLRRRADLTQYTTAASAEDLEQVREALGFEQINLFGGSYGTRLAMEYVRKYESRVRAVVLDGPVPTTVRMPEDFGRLAQRSLDALLDECAASAACAGAFPEIRHEARAVFERLERGPATTTVGHPAASRQGRVTLTRDHVAETVRYMLYASGSAGDLPLYLHEAAKGNYAPFAEFLIRRRAGGTFDGLYLSITCAEDVPFLSADAGKRDERTYLGTYRIREQRAACAEWPRGAAPEWHGRPVAARVPVLILSGTLDPVTPPEHGDDIARTLPNSLHIRVPHGGHSPNGLSGVECLDRLKSRFIETADVRALDASCVTGITRPAFRTRP